jgi:uncharacterized integral membrane protein (TIGR00697 family)
MEDIMDKKLVVLASFFVTSLVLSNIISSKLMIVAGFVLPVGVILFPISYIIGDVLAEVFGYRVTRFVILLGFVCNLFAVFVIWLAIMAPPAPVYEDQLEFTTVLGFTPRLLVASFIAYLIGEIANAKVMVYLKKVTSGRWLWTRTVSSTVIGQGLDSLIFITIAFWGIIPLPVLTSMILAQWLFKVAYEAVATPITYLVVAKVRD